MIKYESFQYIYPPRPKNPIHHSDLSIWDNGSMMAQVKMNGSNCTIYMNETKVYVYNRHSQRLSNFEIDLEEIRSLYKGKGWMVLNGEYMNKSKKDSKNETFNNKFCIFDLLVLDNQHLIGTTFDHRTKILNEFYGQGSDFIHRISNNVYKIESYYADFLSIYDRLTSIDMVEGLVLKRKSARLENGTTENNNFKSQIKVRKPTKNYKY